MVMFLLLPEAELLVTSMTAPIILSLMNLTMLFSIQKGTCMLRIQSTIVFGRLVLMAMYQHLQVISLLDLLTA
jgi:hypothetical protein